MRLAREAEAKRSRLTRRVVRVLLALSACMVAGMALPPVVGAAVISVDTASDEYGTGGSCSLREAVESANTNTGFGGCISGELSPDTLVIQFAGNYQLTRPGADDTNVLGDLDISAGGLTIAPSAYGITVDGSGGGDRVFHVHGGVPAVTIQGINVRGGSTSFFGGAIENNGGLTLAGVTLKDNYAAAGGGALATINSGATNAYDLTISGNTTAGDGGGVLNAGSATTSINNATIADNFADADLTGAGGGGVANSGTSLSLANTIVAGNTDLMGGEADECKGTLTSQGHNILGSLGECPFAPTTGDQTATPVPLRPFADNGGLTLTRVPLEGSAAINAGHPGSGGGTPCVPFEQRNFTRPIDGRCDVGAIDRIPAQTITPGGGCSLQGALDAAYMNEPVGACPRGGDVFDTIPLGAGTSVISVPLQVRAPRVAVIGQPGQTALDGTLTGANGIVHVHPEADALLTGLTIAGADRFTGPGGGIENEGTLELSDSTVRNNVATGAGGGIHSSGALTLSNSTIRDNVSGGAGAGIYSTGDLTLSRVTLSANHSSDNGGGISVEGPGATTLSNVTISGNRANNNGGGLSAGAGSGALLNNVTVTANTANFDNFGTNGGGGLAGSVDVTIANTLVAGNTDTGSSSAPECSGGLSSAGHNLLGALTGCALSAGTGDQTGISTLNLGPLASNGAPTMTHALLAGSSALNAGYPGSGPGTACATTDQRGIARPQEGRCDVGAFEFQPPATIPPPAGNPPTPTAPAKKCKKGRKLKKGKCVKKKKKKRA